MSKLKLLLKKDVQLQASNRIATNTTEFDECAYKFKKGTIFINYGKNDTDPDEDEDCIENNGPHGWCWSDEYPHIQYCNFHAYILDYWPEFPELFEKVEE